MTRSDEALRLKIYWHYKRQAQQTPGEPIELLPLPLHHPSRRNPLPEHLFTIVDTAARFVSQVNSDQHQSFLPESGGRWLAHREGIRVWITWKVVIPLLPLPELV